MKSVGLDCHSADFGLAERNDLRHLFLTHVGAPGGAEYQMLSIVSKTQGGHGLTFQRGVLQDLFVKAGVPLMVLDMPENLQEVRRSNGLLSILRAIPAALKMSVRLISAVRQFDILVPMSQKSFVLLALSRPFVRKPIIWYMNDLLSEKHFSPALIGFMKFLARFGADHIFFNSEASRKAWIEAGGRASGTSVSFPGTNVEKLDALLLDVDRTKSIRQEFSPDGAPLVTIVGRISRWKGQDVFLKALALIPGARGVIVGDALFGEEAFREELKQLIAELGLADRVTFAGHREDVANIMAASDVVVHCSTSPEPFGLVIVEAMACGAPVVAARDGGPMEIVIDGETGQLTTPGAADELAEAIRKYLLNPGWARQLATAARVRAIELYSSRAMVNRYRSVVNSVV